MKCKSCGLLLTLALFLMLFWSRPLRAGQARLVPEELITVSFPKVRLKRNEVVDWWVYRIVPYGSNRFLAVVERDIERWDPWVEKEKLKKEAKERGVVTSYVPEWKSSLLIAIMDKYGEIVDIGETRQPPPDRYSKQSVPLLMDLEPSCPFAVLDPGTRRITCFDYELGYLKDHHIPIDEIVSARATYDGARYTVWVFGRGYSTLEEGDRELTRYDGWKESLPKVPVLLGAKFYPADGRLEPLPVDLDDLVARLERIARGPDGDKLKLQRASIRLVAFDDTDNSEPFWVLIEAVSSDEYRNPLRFSGLRLYFRGKLDSQGLGKIEQLPVWIRQGPGDNSPRLNYDEDTGVLTFPEFFRPVSLRAYSFGPRERILYLAAAYGEAPHPPGKRGWHFFAPLLLYFSDASQHPVPVGYYQDRWLDDIAEAFADQPVNIVSADRPVGVFGKRQLLLDSICSDRKSDKPMSCLVVASVESE